MTPTEIMNDIYKDHEEYLEMMDIEEKFAYITNILLHNLALEMAERKHYQECFNSLCRGKGIDS